MTTTGQNSSLRLRSRNFYHGYVRKPALRVCTSVLQHAPIHSEWFGPPKGIRVSARQWLEEAAAQSASSAGSFHRAFAEERLHYVPLQTIEAEADFYSFYAKGLDSPLIQEDEAGRRHTDLPATFVAEIPGGRAFGCDGAVITPNDYLLQDISPEYTANRYLPGKHTVLAQLRLPKVYAVQGTVAVLATLGAQEYFAHWMMDLLPRIGVLEKAGFRLSQIDKFFVNSPRLPYQRQTLEHLGIPGSKIIDCTVHPHIKAERLIVPSPVSGVFAASSETCGFLRRSFPAPLAGPDFSKRIYVSRAGTAHRRVVNEREVVELLSGYGFSSIEPQTLSLAEQSQAFAHADAVVMPLGSAMANTVHCHPGAKIIEILNPRSVQACTWAVCSQQSAEYYFLFAQGVSSSESVLSEDLWVDVSKLRQTLELAGLR